MMLGFTLDVGGLLIDRSKALVCRQSRGYTLPSLCRPEALQRDEKVWGRFDRNAAMRLAGHDLTDEEDTDIEELDFQDEDGIVVLRDRENGGYVSLPPSLPLSRTLSSCLFFHPLHDPCSECC